MEKHEVSVGVTREAAELLREAFGAIGVSVEQGIEYLSPFYASRIISQVVGLLILGILLTTAGARMLLCGWRYEADGYHDNKGAMTASGGAVLFVCGVVLLITVAVMGGDAHRSLRQPRGLHHRQDHH